MIFKSSFSSSTQFQIKNLLLISLRILMFVFLFNQSTPTSARFSTQEQFNEDPIERKNSIRYIEASSISGQDKDRNKLNSIRDSLPELSSDLKNYQVDPMKTAASNHHKKGAKGWLDMGAWTKKKGAFGWYADFPVGKGK